MRRPQKPWFRQFNNTWCICLNGKQVVLAKGKNNKAQAERVFHRLMAGDALQVAKPSGTLVAEIIDLFLDHSQKHNSSNTFDWYSSVLKDFKSHYGGLSVVELKPFHVSRWLDAHPTWKGSRWGTIVAAKRAFNWATDEELIAANPIKKVKKPPIGRRERYLTVQERQHIFDSYPVGDPFRDFLFAMEQTGCRPGEIASVTAQDVDLDKGLWVLKNHKTRHQTGEARVVVLTSEMLIVTNRLMEKNPLGTLFRNNRGKPWTGNAIRFRFRRIRKKLKLGDDLVAYLYRHAVCTDLLESGCGLAQTAEILGHKSTEMIMKHYSKLSLRRDHLREQLENASRRHEQE